jgi:hypothetical protein
MEEEKWKTDVKDVIVNYLIQMPIMDGDVPKY